jgi:tRNA pseudouridine38-40 synthase
MSRFFIELSYAGTAYHGWQRQITAISVQEIVEDGLAKVLRAGRITVMGCGRTDTGVHASSYFMHVDLPEETDISQLHYKWNHFLPSDISLHRFIPVHDKAHARYDATAREYRYHIHREKDSFKLPYSLYLWRELDLDSMQKAAALLIGKKDFNAFARSHGSQKTSMCDVRKAQWTTDGPYWTFTIEADRFLRNMVRAVVGTLLQVGMGKLTIEGFQKVIDNKDRKQAGSSAPANGLFLSRIDYPYIQD